MAPSDSTLPQADTVAHLLEAGVACHRAGRLDDALACYEQVLAVQPDQPDAGHLSGLIAFQRGDIDRAVALMSNASAAAPGNPAIHNNLGLAHAAERDHASAAENFRRAIALSPSYAEAHCNLGNMLAELGQAAEAEACYRNALTIAPGFAGACFNLGNVLRDQGRLQEASAAFENAIAINPAYAKAHNNLADVLKSMDRVAEALEHFRRACEIEPGSADYHSNLIFIQDFDPDIDISTQQTERQHWNEKFCLPQLATITPHENDRTPDRRLRVGYVSGDFRVHSACEGFAPLITGHDSRAFEVFCYSTAPKSDSMTETLRTSATQWREVSSMSDEKLSETIRADGIDILVDLAGHTHGSRLGVFARKPAPVQVTGIGHLPPGLSTIDYRLTTKDWTYPAEEPLFPEAPVYQETMFGFRAPEGMPEVSPAPGLNSGVITFGSMNRLSKISPEVRAAWAKILIGVPTARLLIKAPGLKQASTKRGILDEFAALGVQPERLVLIGGTNQAEHLRTFQDIDIHLDPFPHGGGITTLESLWMGVPVLGINDSLKMPHRLIATILRPLGLEDWIARSPDDYCARALAWASRPNELARLRTELRDRVANVYGTHPARVEAAYRVMWQRWCAGETPSAIDMC